MIWKLVLLTLALWCLVYTLSYGVFEYKRKNPLGAAGVFALCAIILLAVPGIML